MDKEKWIKERYKKQLARRESYFAKKRETAKAPSSTATPATFRPSKGEGVSLSGGGAGAWTFPKAVAKTVKTPSIREAASAPSSPRISSAAPKTNKLPSITAPPKAKTSVAHQAGATISQFRTPVSPRPPATTPSGPATPTPRPTSGGGLASFYMPRGSEYVAAGLAGGLAGKVVARRRAAAKALRTSQTTAAQGGRPTMTLGHIGAGGSTSGSPPTPSAPPSPPKMTLATIGAKPKRNRKPKAAATPTPGLPQAPPAAPKAPPAAPSAAPGKKPRKAQAPAAPATPAPKKPASKSFPPDYLEKKLQQNKPVRVETPTTPPPVTTQPATGTASADQLKQLEEARAENIKLKKQAGIPLQTDAPKITPVEQTPEAPPEAPKKPRVVRRKKGQTRQEAIAGGAVPELPPPAKNAPSPQARDPEIVAARYKKLRGAETRPSEKGGPKPATMDQIVQGVKQKRISREQRMAAPAPEVVNKPAKAARKAAKQAGQIQRVTGEIRPVNAPIFSVRGGAGKVSQAHADVISRAVIAGIRADTAREVYGRPSTRMIFKPKAGAAEKVAQSKPKPKPIPAAPKPQEVFTPQTKGETVGSQATTQSQMRAAEIQARKAQVDKFMANARKKGRAVDIVDEQGNKVGVQAAKSKRAAKSGAGKAANAIARRSAARRAALARDAAELSSTPGKVARGVKIGSLGAAAILGSSLLAAQEARAGGATRTQAAKAGAKEAGAGAGIIGGIAAASRIPGIVGAIAKRASPIGILAGMGVGALSAPVKPGVSNIDLVEAMGRGGAEATMVPTIGRGIKEGTRLGKDLLSAYLERRASKQKYGSIEAATRTRRARRKNAK